MSALQRVQAVVQAASVWSNHDAPARIRAVEKTLGAKNSFTVEALNEAIDLALSRICESDLLDWMNPSVRMEKRQVTVLNAGNIPFVGLQDLLAVVIAGHGYIGVTSAKSPHLLPAFAESIRRYDPSLDMEFTSLDEACERSDALIATGSSATVQIVSRRFVDAGIPPGRQLLRGTRYGVAVVSGSESDEAIQGLARDVLLHEGRGCRNVAVVLAPVEFESQRFIVQAEQFRRIFPAHETTIAAVARTVRFLRSVGEPFLEAPGLVIPQTGVAMRDPCVLRWIRFQEESEAWHWIVRHSRLLQVVVSDDSRKHMVPAGVDWSYFGQAQNPPLNWRPDGIDSMSFLQGLA